MLLLALQRCLSLPVAASNSATRYRTNCKPYIKPQQDATDYHHPLAQPSRGLWRTG